jgi:hypothetical protein
MSAGDINVLLNLWAASLAKHGDEPPFSSAADLYNTIDATTLGDVAWESFSLRYNGEQSEEEAPIWTRTEFVVWYRDARTTVHRLLANPDFDHEFDYAPYQEYDAKGCHRFQDFMSGNWSWKQAVRCHSLLNPVISSLSVCPGHDCQRS